MIVLIKKIIFVLIMVFACLAVVCGNRTASETPKVSLTIYGEEVLTQSEIMIDKKNSLAILPLLEIVEKLGAFVEWQDNSIVCISVESTIYYLDTVNLTLTDENNEHDYLLEPPGHSEGGRCEMKDQELMIDDIWAKQFLQEVMDVKVSINFKKLTIEITKE